MENRSAAVPLVFFLLAFTFFVLAVFPARAQQTAAGPNIAGIRVTALLERLGASLERETSAEQMDAYARLFRLIDRDGDGRHSRLEYIEKGRYLTPEARRGIFFAADADRDRFVSEAEYILNRIITDEAKGLLQAMDDDGDGLVQWEEFASHAETKLGDSALTREVFAALDTNSDSELAVPESLRVWGQWARAGNQTAEQRIATVKTEYAAKQAPAEAVPFDPPRSREETIVLGAIHPHLSADGRLAVFSYQGAIWRMPSDGGVMTRLTAEPGVDLRPVLSPDAASIAFLRTEGGQAGVVNLIGARDGKPRALPRAIQARGRLQFDREGRRLLGSYQQIGRGWSLRWLDLASGRLGPVLLPKQEVNAFTLSAKGDRIFTVTNRDVSQSHTEQEGNNGPQSHLWSMAAEGGDPVSLFEFPARIYHLEPTAEDRSLHVVTDIGGAHYDIWKIPLTRPAAAERITFGQGDEDHPSASGDGRFLLFTDNRRGATALRLRSRASGQERELSVSHKDFRSPVGTLDLRIVDGQSTLATTARIVLRRRDGKFHAPRDALYGIWGRQLHFYASDRETLELPEGSYALAASRGPEYRTIHETVEIVPGTRQTLSLSLERWIDQPAAGWYSGENHIHANYGRGYWYQSPRSMLTICAGEDLHIANLMVANSDGDGVFDREYFRGRPDASSTSETLLYWNEEFRSTIWGHMTLLHLRHLVEPIFTGFASTTHPHDHVTNADIAAHTHDQGGLVNYTHPAQIVVDPYLSAYSAKALPIDVALGVVDSIDVMGSNHAANSALWYRLLNCGFVIPASAGTDCFSNRIPARRPGEVRVFVRTGDEHSYASWIDNLKRGRSFATNGPMLEFTAGGVDLGETVTLSEPGELAVSGQVRSQFPLHRVELIFNGNVIESSEADASAPTSLAAEWKVFLPHSGWLALRARGHSHADAIPGQFAHTSPIYVEVAGLPHDCSGDARYFLRWIDRLWADVQARGRILPRHHAHVKSQIDRAKAVYEALAKR